ncbi:MAG: diacylglycerol/lipid kinase family protein [Bacteroidales bacterium]
MKNNWMIIVNPNAGSRKAGKDWEKIKFIIDKTGITYEIMLTKAVNHAIEITKIAIDKGFRNFIAIGGDGTLNEIVNGIFSQSKVDPSTFKIGIIPIGTGNDWCRMFNIPFDYKKAIEIIIEGTTFIQDIGKVIYHKNNEIKERFFINVTGIGYDAMVAEKTNAQKAKGKGGKFSYFLNIFTSLFYYKDKKISITTESKNIKTVLFSMNVGICKYNGGGMMQLPNAIADDGLLDITIIQKISKIDLISNIKKLYDGNITNHPKVISFQATNININSDHKIYIEADGESLGHSPFTFSILPKSLQVIVGKHLKK